MTCAPRKRSRRPEIRTTAGIPLQRLGASSSRKLLNARQCVDQEPHRLSYWIVLNGYFIASWVKRRHFASRAAEGSLVRSFRNVLQVGSPELLALSMTPPSWSECSTTQLMSVRGMFQQSS